MPVEAVCCYICGREGKLDKHHYDCMEGKLSPETVPLCRRCHRTYHDWGISNFDDEYLDKAIEIENKRRELFYASLEGPVKPLQLVRREDIKRTDYWYKKHGIKRERFAPSLKDTRAPAHPFHLPLGEPLCGWDWVHEHLDDLVGWVPRIEITGPGQRVVMDIDSKAKLKDAVKVLQGIKGSSDDG